MQYKRMWLCTMYVPSYTRSVHICALYKSQLGYERYAYLCVDGDVQRLADGLGVGLQVDMGDPKNWWLILCCCTVGLRYSLITACNERAGSVWDVGACVTNR